MKRVASVALLAVLTACAPAPTPVAVPTMAPAPAAPAVHHGTVTDIVDGDTVHVVDAVSGAEAPVRPLGIDTPETKDPRIKKIECGGIEATAFATRELLGQQVDLITDPTQGILDPQSGDRLDKYHRTLAYLVLTSGPHAGSDYSVLAAAAGMGRSDIYDHRHPPQQIAAIQAAERDAQAAGRGIWGASCHGRP